ASCMLCTGRMNRSRKCISLHDALPILKMKDKYARTSDITKKDKSVLTGRTIKQVEKAADNVWQSNRTNGQETKKKRSATQSKKQAPSKGVKKAMPKNVSPMLATLVDKPFDEEGWIYEV